MAKARRAAARTRVSRRRPALSRRINGTRLGIEICAPTIVRVTAVPHGSSGPRESFAVIDRNVAPARVATKRQRGATVIDTGSLQVTVSDRTGAVSFADSRGRVLLAETGRELTAATVLDEPTFHVRQEFCLGRGEALYGFGQHQQGIMNYRGHELRLAQFNMEVAVPVMISSKGYGILWDNASETLFDDTANSTSISSEVAEAIDYYFMYGPEIDTVIDGYRRLTGTAPLFPKWAYGLFQCKERYTTQEELLNIVNKYRRRGIPLDCIVQDWRYWDPYAWGSHRLDPQRYPDPAGMTRQLHEKHHCALMISVWPRFMRGSENYEQLRGNGYLYREYLITTPRNHPWQEVNDPEAYYDAFNPGARKMYWDQMNNWLFTKGVDAWWLDATEPELNYRWERRGEGEKIKEYMTGCMSGARTRNAFPLMTTRAVYEGQRAYTSDKRVYILTRSAFAGQQRHGATTWSGDIVATWDVFRGQIAAGLNFSLSGIPYWTTDIGGFFVQYKNGCENPEYRELFLRWFQFGTFCPIFRVHGTSTPREVWRFGKPGEVHYDTQLKFDNLRYRLMPYVYSLAWQVRATSATIMRHLVFDFRTDPRVRDIADQFMFGPALMVNPVTAYKARTRSVYLPKGTAWYDFWTGTKLTGGRTVRAAAPLHRMPLYVKAGSILPMGPFMQYASHKPADPLELRIYRGADGRFTLYEDEGDTYNYEKGAYATIEFVWNDRRNTLTIGKRRGRFPGMLHKRIVRLVPVGPKRGVGVEVSGMAGVEVEYAGEEIEAVL